MIHRRCIIWQNEVKYGLFNGTNTLLLFTASGCIFDRRNNREKKKKKKEGNNLHYV